jgi:hypothetical protein
MIKINKIVWDFEGTEFEDCDHDEACNIAVLPRSLKLKEKDIDSDADIDDIIDHISENYGFQILSIDIDES